MQRKFIRKMRGSLENLYILYFVFETNACLCNMAIKIWKGNTDWKGKKKRKKEYRH